MGTYTVKQGDHLPRIAEEHGFFDYRTIWDHPQNQALKEKRKNPNVLAPGDALFVPDKTPRKENGATGEKHRFQVKPATLRLRLVLEDIYGAPIANARCRLTVEGATFEVVSGGDGRVEHDVPLTAEQAELVVVDGETPLKDVTLRVEIGHLDPVDTTAGQRSRLSNLGYFLGALDGDDEAQFRSAVEEFQCDQGLTVDGDCGPNTQARLKAVHGC